MTTLHRVWNWNGDRRNVSGHTAGCEAPHCIEQHKRFRPNRAEWCSGEALKRNGYFVYQLETGYIGMTYNPSRRQREHEADERKRHWAESYMAGRNDIHIASRTDPSLTLEPNIPITDT